MVKFFVYVLIFTGVLSWSAVAAFVGEEASTVEVETTKIEKSQDQSILKVSQSSTDPKDRESSAQILKAGQYDKAYDYYVQGNYLKAFYEALKRAEYNDPAAQTLIGQMYMEGYAVPLDGKRAALWFGSAAKNGDPQAQLRYGLMLFSGTFVTKDKERGIEFIQKATHAGVREAYFYYGQIVLHKAFDEKQHLEGVDLQNQQDEAKEQALVLFLRGAALGDPEAAFAAARILSVGTLTKPKDDYNARRLIEVAAQNKHLMAQIMLAQWLIEGRGGETDFKRAFYLLFDNAVKMVAVAQVNLARLYRDGIGVEGDVVTAAAWYMVAKQAKVQASDLEVMLQGMDEAQLKKAEQKAVAFIPVL
ncbi:tetratricopeptide repeat protein [Bartonella bovis]|uniref:tetratricopeptide repeat protein n=1 Tax=Bartonella bovis TaxID=155194 RepID=UPI001FCF1791|nr:tetratricopeptide repeat protein [Bartonella bovis]